MNEQHIIRWIKCLWKIRHDGYLHKHYVTIKDGYIVDFGKTLTRQDDIRFFVRLLKQIRYSH